MFGNGAVRDFENRAATDIKSRLNGRDAMVVVRSKSDSLIGAVWGAFRSARIEASRFSTDELPLFTEPNRNGGGRVGMLELALSDFKLGILEIKCLKASIPNCRFDLPLARRSGAIRLSRSGIGTGEVQIEEEALERFILAKFKEIRTVDVRCDRGWVWVEGDGEFLIVQSKFRVLAKLEPLGESQIVLARSRVALDGLPADPSVAAALLQLLNPVVDLDDDLGLHGAILLDRIDVGDGKLVAIGRTTIPVIPN